MTLAVAFLSRLLWSVPLSVVGLCLVLVVTFWFVLTGLWPVLFPEGCEDPPPTAPGLSGPRRPLSVDRGGHVRAFRREPDLYDWRDED